MRVCYSLYVDMKYEQRGDLDFPSLRNFSGRYTTRSVAELLREPHSADWISEQTDTAESTANEGLQALVDHRRGVTGTHTGRALLKSSASDIF